MDVAIRASLPAQCVHNGEHTLQILRTPGRTIPCDIVRANRGLERDASVYGRAVNVESSRPALSLASPSCGYASPPRRACGFAPSARRTAQLTGANGR